MYLPPLQPIERSDIHISGDVEIHPSATLAPGVILYAAAGSRIEIGADVCLGMGVIIHACEGLVAIQQGAVLGPGVLIVGQAEIGQNACVGSVTTIFYASVEPLAMISAGSVLGDKSRPGEIKSENSEDLTISRSKEVNKNNAPDNNLPEDLWDDSKPGSNGNQPSPLTSEQKTNSSTKLKQPKNKTETLEVQITPPANNIPIAGKVYINELLLTLFPHKQSEEDLNKNDSS